jgi:predicted Holliday junction resolvase-like endonuclease
MWEYIALFLVLVVAVMFLLYRRAQAENLSLKEELGRLVSSRQSLSTKYGRMSEQFMPFLKDYPYESQDFRFIGTPVDGVQFNKDGIVFVEFKTSGSKLTERQKEIKELVRKGKVEFLEFRMGDKDG